MTPAPLRPRPAAFFSEACLRPMREGLRAAHREETTATKPDRAGSTPTQPRGDVRSTLWVLLALGFLGGLSWFAWPDSAAEDQWLEWVQVLLLLATALLHARSAGRSAWPAVLHAGLGLLTLSFAVREVDIDRIGSSPNWLLAERVIRAGVGLLWVWWGWRTWRRVGAVRALWPGVLREPWLHLTVIAGVLFVAAWLLDRELLPLAKDLSRFLEELVELQADAAMLAAALAMRREPATPLFRRPGP